MFGTIWNPAAGSVVWSANVAGTGVAGLSTKVGADTLQPIAAVVPALMIVANAVAELPTETARADGSTAATSCACAVLETASRSDSARVNRIVFILEPPT